MAVRRSQKGRGKYRIAAFTLTELLVSILVGLLVLAGVHRVFIAGLSTQNTASLQSEMNRKAQVGLDSVVSKLRGSSGVNDASANRIWFLDQDGNNCRFWVNAGTLRRYVGAAAGSYTGGDAVATDVVQFALTYRDRNGAVTTTPSLVYSADVVLEVRRSSHSARLESNVRLRNK